MNYSILLDVSAIAILMVSAFVMSRRGLLKSIYKILSIVVTIIAVMLFSGSAKNVLDSFGVNDRISDFVYTSFLSEDKPAEETAEHLPGFFDGAIADVTENSVVPAVTDAIISIICAIAIYLICKLVLYILFLFIQQLFKMPVLKQVNKLVGTAAGLVSGLIIIYLILGIASLNVANAPYLREVIDSTYFVKLFYDQNILMNLFLK